MAIDLRRFRVGIEISGRVAWYEAAGLRVRANGVKYASPTKNECNITLSGLSQDTRNFLLTETSPFNANRTPKRVYLEVGRQSWGLFRLFAGDIVGAEPSGPPDFDLLIRAKTQAAAAGNVVAQSAPALARLSDLTRTAAATLGLAPQFEATDLQVSNFAYTGGALGLVAALQDAGNVRAHIDDDALIVTDRAQPLAGRVRVLNQDSGMVGIPKATEKGVKVAFTVDPETRVGGTLQIESRLNPALSGRYTIDQLAFDVASHDEPFFYTAQATRQ